MVTMPMHTLRLDSLRELSALSQAPCLSLYQPTHRSHPDNAQVVAHFKQGVQALEGALSPSHVAADVQALMAPFHALASDTDFWRHTLDGLAVLGCQGVFRVFVLPRSMPMLAMVSDSFHTKPLRRFLQSVERYQVLCLSRDRAQLFEGNRDALHEVALNPAVPATATQALGAELTEPHQTVTSHGGVGQGRSPLFHSTGGKKDEIDHDTERYFRALDRALTEHHAPPGGLPIILAALSEHQHLYRQVSHNSSLLPTGLNIHPQALDMSRLTQLAWAVVAPQHQARQQVWLDDFRLAKSRRLTCDNLVPTALAAAQGRIASLLIESERQLPGWLDHETGRVVRSDQGDPASDDLLDDLADLVQNKGGTVHVVSQALMPTTTGVAAILRH
jgi:hypothetical protein